MTEQYLKLVKDEVRNNTLTQLPSQRLEVIAGSIRKLYTGLNPLDDLSMEIFKNMMNKIMGDVENLAKIRLFKTVISGTPETSSIDYDAGKTAIAILRAEKTMLSPVIIKYGDKVLYYFKETCDVSGRRFRRGEIGLLSTRELVLAELQECGEPVEDPVVRLLIKPSDG